MPDIDRYEKLKVFIIEYLDISDDNTGTQLYSDLFKYLHLKENNFSAELFISNSNTDIFEIFKKIEIDISSDFILPIIHIEAHGDEIGFGTNSGEFFKWRELYDLLIKINTTVQNKLFLVLSMCEGGWINRYFNPFKRAPFKYLISSPNIVSDKEILSAFHEFYQTLFYTSEGTLALRRLNNEIKNPMSYFVLLDIEERYDYFLSLYLEPINKQNQIREDLKNERLNNPKFNSLPIDKQIQFVTQRLDSLRDKIISSKDYCLMTSKDFPNDQPSLQL